MFRSFILLAALVAVWFSPRVSLASTGDGVGMAVVATDGATDAAWPLARAVYTSALLRPSNLDDARARVLAGEAAPEGAPSEIHDLAELRAGVKGDDAASREVLNALAEKLSVHSVLVVFAGDVPSARLFDAQARAFDAARYQPDASGKTWDGAIRSLEKPYLPQPAVIAPQSVSPTSSPVLASSAPSPTKKSESKAFYESPWFWVALGAAVLIGGGVLIATTVQTSDTVHMTMKLP